MSMLAHVDMHVRGIEVIIEELMVPTFYFTNKKKFWRQLRYIMKSPLYKMSTGYRQ